MTRTKPILNLGLYRAATGLTAIVSVNSLYLAWTRPDLYRWPALVWLIIGVATAAVGWALSECRAGSTTRIGIRAYVVVAVAALILEPVLLVNQGGPLDYSHLWCLITCGICVAPVAFSPRVSLIGAPAFAAYTAVMRAPLVGWTQSVLEGALAGVVALLCAEAVRVLHRASARVEQATTDSWEARETLARADERAFEKQRWDGLVHDKVLGALRLAGRGGGSGVALAAQELACDAADALRNRPTLGPVGGIPETIAAYAARLGLTVDLRLAETEIGDSRVRGALVGAICEALTNVARHSGSREALVEGSVGPQVCRVRVRDLGVGLGPRSVGTGIELGIIGRMRAVGGEASVRPGEPGGTVVELAWQPTEGHRSWLGSWREQDFYSMLALGVVAMAIHLVIGLTYLDRSRAPGWTVVGMAVLALTVAAVVLVPRTGHAWLVTSVLLAVVPAALAVNLVDRQVHDWRYWFLGALDLPVAALSMRIGRWAGIGTAGGILLAVAGAEAATGTVAWRPLLDAWAVVLCSSFTAFMLRTAIDTSTAFVTETAERTGLLRLESVRLQEREAELRRRVDHLGGSVLPMLDVIASGRELDPQERATCLALEAQARDQLSASSVLTPSLVSEIASARARGASVRISARGEGRAEHVETFRRVCLEVLRTAETGSRVVMLWRPDDRGRLGSVALTGQALWSAEVATVESTAVGVSGCVVAVSSDEDSTLVELRLGLQSAVAALPVG